MPEPPPPAGAAPAPEVVVVVPCYDEGQRLPVAAFRAFADAHPRFTFLFVDDGSRDDTRAVLEGLHEERPGAFSVLALDRNVGKGEAVRRGILAAAARVPRFLAYWDADLATPLDALPDFRGVFEERPAVEIVLGSRVKLLGRDIDRRPLRHYLGRVFATAASATLGLGVYDTQCGAKMFRATGTVLAIFAEPFTSRWIFDVELLARFLRRRRDDPGPTAVESCFYELPLRAWRDVAGSKVKPVDFFVAFVELLRIARRYHPSRGRVLSSAPFPPGGPS